MSTVDILGTKYTLERHKYNDHPFFKEYDKCGECDDLLKRIAVADASSLPNMITEDKKWMLEYEKETLRHEVVHAYFNESGLKDCTTKTPEGWSKFEELIDWIAIQGKKIAKTWSEVEAWIDEIYKNENTNDQDSDCKNSSDENDDSANHEKIRIVSLWDQLWNRMERFSESTLDELDKIDREVTCEGCDVYNVEKLFRRYDNSLRCHYLTGSVTRIAPLTKSASQFDTKYVLHCDAKITSLE